jgi:hypothetical protein
MLCIQKSILLPLRAPLNLGIENIKLKGLLNNGNYMVNIGLRLRFLSSPLLRDDELLEHAHHIMHHFMFKFLLFLGLLLLTKEGF